MHRVRLKSELKGQLLNDISGRGYQLENELIDLAPEIIIHSSSQSPNEAKEQCIQNLIFRLQWEKSFEQAK